MNLAFQKLKLLTCAALLATTWPGVARASESPFGKTERGGGGATLSRRFAYNFERAHDRGVYARFGLGPNVARALVTPALIEEEGAGSGAQSATMGSQLVVGFYPVERLVLHLGVMGDLGATRGFIHVGPGVSFYFQEQRNLYVSLSLPASTFYDASPDIAPLTQWGQGVIGEAGVGRWVSPHGVLGLALTAGAAGFDYDGDGIAGSSRFIGLRATLSIN